jgi:uncharacterized membrane protein YeaQ/YmgE (transglycosylase-associated protein family)
MNVFTLIILALSGGLIGALIGMAFSVDFECDKKYGKAVLTYLICILIGSLIFTVPPLIMCM